MGLMSDCGLGSWSICQYLSGLICILSSVLSCSATVTSLVCTIGMVSRIID